MSNLLKSAENGEFDPELCWLYHVFHMAHEKALEVRISHISLSSAGGDDAPVGVYDKTDSEMLRAVYAYVTAQTEQADAEIRSTPPLSRQNSSHSLHRQGSRQPGCLQASEFEVLRSQLGRIEGAVGSTHGFSDHGAGTGPSREKSADTRISLETVQAQLERIEMRLNGNSGAAQILERPSAFDRGNPAAFQSSPTRSAWQPLTPEVDSTVCKTPALLALPRGDGTPLPASCTWACSAPAVAGDARYVQPGNHVQAQPLVPLTEARADSRPQPPRSLIDSRSVEASPRSYLPRSPLRSPTRRTN